MHFQHEQIMKTKKCARYIEPIHKNIWTQGYGEPTIYAVESKGNMLYFAFFLCLKVCLKNIKITIFFLNQSKIKKNCLILQYSNAYGYIIPFIYSFSLIWG